MSASSVSLDGMGRAVSGLFFSGPGDILLSVKAAPDLGREPKFLSCSLPVEEGSPPYLGKPMS